VPTTGFLRFLIPQLRLYNSTFISFHTLYFLHIQHYCNMHFSAIVFVLPFSLLAIATPVVSGNKPAVPTLPICTYKMVMIATKQYYSFDITDTSMWCGQKGEDLREAFRANLSGASIKQQHLYFKWKNSAPPAWHARGLVARKLEGESNHKIDGIACVIEAINLVRKEYLEQNGVSMTPPPATVDCTHT